MLLLVTKLSFGNFLGVVLGGVGVRRGLGCVCGGTSVYGERIVDGEIDELLAELSALSIEDPQAVGKTTTALQ